MEEIVSYCLGVSAILGGVLIVYLSTRNKNCRKLFTLDHNSVNESLENKQIIKSTINNGKAQNNKEESSENRAQQKKIKSQNLQFYLIQQLLDQKYWKYTNCPEQYIIEQVVNQDYVMTRFGKHLRNILGDISSGYHNIEYHNLTHAFDVTTSLNEILTGDFRKKLNLQPNQYLMCLLAAYAHDINHQGLSNAFYLNSKHEWSTLYGDQSQLEKMHIRSLFKIMDKYPEISFQHSQKQLITAMILATDNNFHSQNLLKISNCATALQISKEAEDKQKLLQKNKFLILGCSLHFADLNNCSKKLEIFVRWSSRLFKEFQHQGLKEMEMGLSITYPTNISLLEKSCGQYLFIKKMVFPLYTQLQIISPQSFHSYQAGIMKNSEHYKVEKNKGRRQTV